MNPIFKNKILLRVYIIWFFRRIVPLMLAQIFVISLALKLFAQKVFFAKVLENAALASNSSYWELLKYLSSAFFQTRPLIQVISLLILGVGALILRDIGKTLITYIKTLQGRRET